MIDHVTYEVVKGSLANPELGTFMAALGLREIEPDNVIFEKGYVVRWWADETGHQIHLVEGEPRGLGLSHFCVVGVGEEQYRALSTSGWLEHNSGAGLRIWLAFGALRVEVRP